MLSLLFNRCSTAIKQLVYRTFPYVNLVLEEFRNLPGYIAGVANPIFEQHQSWWDLCCNIQTGKISFNSKLQTPFPTSQSEIADNEFVDVLEYHIQQKCSDEVLQSLFTRYTEEIIDIAFNERVFADEEEKNALLKIHLPRCSLWGSTPSYRACQQEIVMKPEHSSIKGLDSKHIRKLRFKKDLSSDEVFTIFSFFEANIKTDEQIIEFLTYFPENQGGLASVTSALFHTSPKVRTVALQFLQRINAHPYGATALKFLGSFLEYATTLAAAPDTPQYLPGKPQATGTLSGMNKSTQDQPHSTFVQTHTGARLAPQPRNGSQGTMAGGAMYSAPQQPQNPPMPHSAPPQVSRPARPVAPPRPVGYQQGLNPRNRVQ